MNVILLHSCLMLPGFVTPHLSCPLSHTADSSTGILAQFFEIEQQRQSDK